MFHARPAALKQLHASTSAANKRIYRPKPHYADLTRVLLVVIARPLWARHHSLEIRIDSIGGVGEYRLFLFSLFTAHRLFLPSFLLSLLPVSSFQRIVAHDNLLGGDRSHP